MRDGLFDRVEPVDVPPLDPRRPHRRPSRRDAGFRRRGRERRPRRRPRGTDNIKSLAMVFGAIESAETGRPCRSSTSEDAELDRTRFSTSASAPWSGPTSPTRPPTSAQILPLGFESIQPFFWQTLGGKDIPRLAGELREAIGDADVDRQRARHVRQSARGRASSTAQTLAGWETLIDNAHLFGTDIVAGFTGRIRGKPLPESLPRFREVWGGSPSAPPTRACGSPSRTAPWTATGRAATGTSPTIPMPGS